MAREGIQSCGELGIRAVALPEQTDTYTVISHGFIIDKVREELTKNNFEIEREEFLYSYGGEVVLSKVHIKSSKDSDMGMVFTWWNSYNKQVKFGCAIGGFIYDNKTSLIGSDGMTWIRKHTGTADTEASNIMEQLIAHANVYFDKIIAEKEKMKAMPLSIESFGCIMGALYFELELISPTQASLVRQEYKKPKHEYKDKDTLWGLYKLIMFGIDEMDLRKWATNQQKIHFTIMNEYLISNDDSKPFVDTLIDAMKESPVADGIDIPNAEISGGFFDAIDNKEETEVKVLKLEDVLPQARIDTYVAQGFIEAQVAGVKVPEEIMDALMNAPEMDVSEVGMFKVTSVDAPEVAPDRVKFAIDETEEESLVIIPPSPIDNKEIFINRMINEEKQSEHLVNYFMEEHYAPLISVDENVGFYYAWHKPAVKVETIIETIAETVIEVPVKATDIEDDLLETVDELAITLPKGFDWLNDDDIEGTPTMETNLLEIPESVSLLDQSIRTKMKKLYGEVKPFHYIEINNYCFVTLDDTKEMFYIQN